MREWQDCRLANLAMAVWRAPRGAAQQRSRRSACAAWRSSPDRLRRDVEHDEDDGAFALECRRASLARGRRWCLAALDERHGDFVRRLTPADERLHGLTEHRLIRIGNGVEHRTADRRGVRLVTDHCRKARIEIGECAVRRDDEDARHPLLDEYAEHLFFFTRLRLGTFALRDVLRRPADPNHSAVGGRLRFAAHGNPRLRCSSGRVNSRSISNDTPSSRHASIALQARALRAA